MRACEAMRCATRCAGIVNVMLMVLMGSRCHTSGMRIQSHAGVTLLPVYMPSSVPSGQITSSDLREPNRAIRSTSDQMGEREREKTQNTKINIFISPQLIFENQDLSF